MNVPLLATGGVIAVVSVLLLGLVTLQRKQISPIMAVRGYVAFGLAFLAGLYLTGMGAGLLPTPVELFGSTQPVAEPRGPADAIDNDLAALIAEELKSDDSQRLFASLTDLQKFPPNGIAAPIQKRVATALVQLIDHPNKHVQGDAVKTTGTWGGAAAVDRLVEIATNKEEELALRRSAIRSLGDIGDERAFEPISKLLPTVVNGEALLAMKKFGGKSEPVGIELLNHEQPGVQIIGCELLAEVGGEKSVEKLNPLIDSDDAKLKAKAEAAIKAIRDRLNQPAN